jgi:hypothetical protein
LPAAIALSSVTTTPARVLGVDHRLGSLRAGNDGDLVVWDSHPLQLGATPVQVYIDGIAQLEAPHHATRSKASLQALPKVPDWGNEAQIHKDARGDPDYAALLKGKSALHGDVAFVNVRNVWIRGESEDGLVDLAADEEVGPKTVLIRDGRIACVGRACAGESLVGLDLVDLKMGSILPGLISFGSTLGLGEIVAEKVRFPTDARPCSSLAKFDVVPPRSRPWTVASSRTRSSPWPSTAPPSLLRMLCTLRFKITLRRASLTSCAPLRIAARSGVSVGITAPVASSQVAGLSFAFDTGAPHPLSSHAVLQEVVALHVTAGHAASEPISTQIANLRKLLLGQAPDAAGYWAKAAKGNIPVVIAVDKLDVMARLINLKKEVQHTNGTSPRFVFHGATEAHAVRSLPYSRPPHLNGP